MLFRSAEVLAAVENILISFKAGKRVATLGKRYVRRGGKHTLATTTNISLTERGNTLSGLK